MVVNKVNKVYMKVYKVNKVYMKVYKVNMKVYKVNKVYIVNLAYESGWFPVTVDNHDKGCCHSTATYQHVHYC